MPRAGDKGGDPVCVCVSPHSGAQTRTTRVRGSGTAREGISQQQPPMNNYPKNFGDPHPAVVAPGVFPCPLPHIHILVLPSHQDGPTRTESSHSLPGIGGHSLPEAQACMYLEGRRGWCKRRCPQGQGTVPPAPPSLSSPADIAEIETMRKTACLWLAGWGQEVQATAALCHHSHLAKHGGHLPPPPKQVPMPPVPGRPPDPSWHQHGGVKTPRTAVQIRPLPGSRPPPIAWRKQ